MNSVQLAEGTALALVDVTAAILAGGEGTRFRPYTELVPKPMIPLGPEERPILEYIVCWLSGQGVRDLVFLVGYRWRQIYNYFGDGARWGVRISYSLDDEVYGGTGGALLKAYEKGLLSDTVLVWYADILAPLDVKKLLDFHASRGADATLVLASRYRVPVGVARVEGEDVKQLEEKPWVDMKVTIGVLALQSRVLSGAREELGTKFDIMGELIPWLISRGGRVKAYLYDGYWFDVGSLERYKKLDERAVAEMLRSCPEKHHAIVV